jgi:hypothetical protein
MRGGYHPSNVGEPSDVIRLLSAIYIGAEGGGNRRRDMTVTIRALCDGLHMAVSRRFYFEDDDWAELVRRWGGLRSCNGVFHCGEGLYSLACTSGNRRAAISYEKWAGRPPFIWHGPRYDRNLPSATGGRLYVGADFYWQDMPVTITSFAEDGSAIRAAAYEETPGVWDKCGTCLQSRCISRERRQLKRRFSITVKDLKEAPNKDMPAPRISVPPPLRKEAASPVVLGRFAALAGTRVRGVHSRRGPGLLVEEGEEEVEEGEEDRP